MQGVKNHGALEPEHSGALVHWPPGALSTQVGETAGWWLWVQPVLHRKTLPQKKSNWMRVMATVESVTTVTLRLGSRVRANDELQLAEWPAKLCSQECVKHVGTELFVHVFVFFFLL